MSEPPEEVDAPDVGTEVVRTPLNLYDDEEPRPRRLAQLLDDDGDMPAHTYDGALPPLSDDDDDDEMSGSLKSTPTLSLPDSQPYAPMSYDAEVRRHLEAELAATATRFERYKAERALQMTALRREAQEARDQANRSEDALQRTREALKERRDAIEAGFHDGQAYAEVQADVTEGSSSSAAVAAKNYVDELRQRKSEELTLRELATVRVADASRAVHNERATLARQFAEAVKEKRAAEIHEREAVENRDAGEKELQRQRRHWDLQKDRYESELRDLRILERSQRTSLEDAAKDLAELAVLRARVAKLEADEERRVKMANDAATALERASALELDCNRRIADAEKLAHLAKLDKRDAETIASAAERRANAAELRSASLERENAEKREDLAVMKKDLLEKARFYDESLTKKTSELEAVTKNRVAELTAARRDFDRNEVEALREARRDAVDAYTREVDRRVQLEKDLDDARREASDAEAKRIAAVSDGAALKKIAAFEVAALTSQNRDLQDQKDASASKAELLKDQLDVAEREYAALQSDSDAEARRLKYQNTALQDKLLAYEQLEVELDAAVIKAGASSSSSTQLTVVPGTTTAAGLSRPERRVRHAILLAQQLLKTQGQLETLKKQEDATAAGRAAAEAALARANARLVDASKPAKYLLKALQDRDDDVAALRRKLDDARRDAQRAASQAKASAEHNLDLEDQVKRLLKHRAELQQLKGLLTQLRSDPNALPPPPPMHASMPPPMNPMMMGMIPPPFVPDPTSQTFPPGNPPPSMMYPSSAMPAGVHPDVPPPQPTTDVTAHTSRTDAHDDQPTPDWVSKHLRVGEVC